MWGSSFSLQWVNNTIKRGTAFPTRLHERLEKTQTSLKAYQSSLCLKTRWILGYPQNAQQRLWLDCADAGRTCNLEGNAVPDSSYWQASNADKVSCSRKQHHCSCRTRTKYLPISTPVRYLCTIILKWLKDIWWEVKLLKYDRFLPQQVSVTQRPDITTSINWTYRLVW